MASAAYHRTNAKVNRFNWTRRNFAQRLGNRFSRRKCWEDEESFGERADSQGGFCASMGGLDGSVAEIRRRAVRERVAGRNETSGYGPLDVDASGGVPQSRLYRSRAAQSGARIEGGSLDAQARN
jgi:hypothetical protein